MMDKRTYRHGVIQGMFGLAWIAWCVLMLVLFTTRVFGAESKIMVEEGVDAKLATQTRTQGVDTVHDEVVVTRYTHEQDVISRHVTGLGTSAVNIFSSTTACHSVIVAAAIENVDTVFVGYPAAAGGPGAVTSSSNSLPLFAGSRQQIRGPNNGSCELIQVVGGAGCGSTPCTVYVMSQ